MNREAFIEAAKRLNVASFSVDGMPEDVYIRHLDGIERNEFETFCHEHKSNNIGIMAKLISMCVSGPSGEQIFTVDDMPEIEKFNATVLMELFEHASMLNALTDDDKNEIMGN